MGRCDGRSSESGHRPDRPDAQTDEPAPESARAESSFRADSAARSASFAAGDAAVVTSSPSPECLTRGVSIRHVTTSANQPSPLPGYWESVRIGWPLLWRGTGTVVVLLFVANMALLGVLPELSRTSPSPLALFVPLLLVGLVAAFVLMPLVVRAMLRRRYRGFRLVFIRNGQDPSTPVHVEHSPGGLHSSARIGGGIESTE